jgi:hypothetical protein
MAFSVSPVRKPGTQQTMLDEVDCFSVDALDRLLDLGV